MKFGTRGAIALAIALAARMAAAHELRCTQTLNEKTALFIDNYPANVTARVTVTNVHPTSSSTATSVVDAFLTSIGGMDVQVPFTLDVGESRTFVVHFTIPSEERCRALARTDGIIMSVVSVGWDLGEAQCTAEIVCLPKPCDPKGDR